MADINAVDLTAETLSSLDGTENVVGFDTAEGKKIPISVLADYVMQKKTQSIAGATQTPQAAVNALNDTLQDSGRNLLAIKKFVAKQQGPEFIDPNEGWVTDVTSSQDSRTVNYANSNWYVDLAAGTYTISWDVKAISSSSSARLVLYSSSGSTIYDASTPYATVGHRSYTFTLSADTSISLLAKIFTAEVRFKIEHGTIDTAWSKAPEDFIEVGVRNLFTLLPENWEQKTIAESSQAGSTYDSMKTTNTTRICLKNLISINGETLYTFNVPSGYAIFVTYFNSNGYMARYISSWATGTITTTTPAGATGMGVSLRNSDNSTISPSDIANIKLKIERGGVATDFIPAQEDIRAEMDALNSKTTGSDTAENTYVTVSYSWAKRANVCTLYLEATPKQAISGSTGSLTLSGIPMPSKPSYSATYDSSQAATVCGPAEITTAGTVCLYGARTKDHVYKASFTYAVN